VDERVDEAGELWTKKKQSKNQKIIWFSIVKQKTSGEEK
jgi:hypothetical protein